MDGANDLTLPRRKASVCHLYSNHEPALGRVKTVRVISSQLMPRVERRPFLRVGSTAIRGRIQVSPNPSQGCFCLCVFLDPAPFVTFPEAPTAGFVDHGSCCIAGMIFPHNVVTLLALATGGPAL